MEYLPYIGALIIAGLIAFSVYLAYKAGWISKMSNKTMDIFRTRGSDDQPPPPNKIKP